MSRTLIAASRAFGRSLPSPRCSRALACGNNRSPAASAPETAAADSRIAPTTPAPEAAAARSTGSEVLTGEAAKGDYRTDAPGVRRKLTPADLTEPNGTPTVRNQPRLAAPPEPGAPPPRER